MMTYDNWCRFLLLLLVAPLFVTACNKGKTRVTYEPPSTPLAFSLTRQGDGVWAVGTGVVTAYGTFSIEQEFDMREDFTYIVFRDRRKGTDQVFKVGATGYVEVHTRGEHKLSIQRFEEKIIIDVVSTSGDLEFLLHPMTNAVARVDFGKLNPEFVILNNHQLHVEYPFLSFQNENVSLDSIDQVVFKKSLGTRLLSFRWKNGIEEPPLEIKINDLTPTSEINFNTLKRSISLVAPHVLFDETLSNGKLVATWITAMISGWLVLVGISMIRPRPDNKSILRKLKGFALVALSAMSLMVAVALIASDPQVSLSLFR